MKKLILSVLLIVGMNFAFASEWYEFETRKDGTSMFIKKNSYSFNQSKQTGQAIVRMTIKKGAPLFAIVVMKSSDCQQGFGSVYFYNTSMFLENQMEYVENGGTIAQTVATAICDIMKSQKGNVL